MKSNQKQWGFSLGAGKKEIPGKRKIYIAVICWVIYYVAIVDKGLWIDLYIFKRLLSICEDRFAILRTPITQEAFFLLKTSPNVKRAIGSF